MCNKVKINTDFLSFKYTRNKILYPLSALLLFSIYVIIRHCQYPLIIRIPLLKKKFLPSSNDNTFYNIAISYVAAYIFYIFQVYIPATLNHYKSYKLLSTSISMEIDFIKNMIFICNHSLKESENKMYIDTAKSSFYFKMKSEDKTYLRKFTYKISYHPYKEQLMTLHNQITANPNLGHLDYAVLYKYCSIPINEFLKFMDSIVENIESCTDLYIISDNILEDIEKAISDLTHNYGFISSTTFSANVSDNEKHIYDDKKRSNKYPEYKYSVTV